MLSTKPQILVVEDETINQIVMRCIIERAGYQCEIVDRGELAIERVKEKTFGLIFMDLGLPGEIDGAKAIEYIRTHERQNQSKALPIIVVSAHVLPESYERLYSTGCNEIFVKPTSPTQIEAVLRKYVPLTNSQPEAA